MGRLLLRLDFSSTYSSRSLDSSKAEAADQRIVSEESTGDDLSSSVSATSADQEPESTRESLIQRHPSLAKVSIKRLSIVNLRSPLVVQSRGSGPLELAFVARADDPKVWLALAWVWCLGGIVVFLRCMLGWIVFQVSLHRDAKEARHEWQQPWKSLKDVRRLRGNVRLLEHDHFGPMLTWTPTGAAVVVPSDFWEELSEPQRLAVLRHEAAHHERFDIWWSLIARLIVWPQVQSTRLACPSTIR